LLKISVILVLRREVSIVCSTADWPLKWRRKFLPDSERLSSGGSSIGLAISAFFSVASGSFPC
jgi:hypothetical protein